MLTQDMIDQARQADLVALAGHGLRKHGAYLTGPCPLCRGGHDRFVIKGNKWLCRHCSEGKYLDPIDFVQRRNRFDFAEAVAYLTSAVALVSAPSLPAAALSRPPESHTVPSATWQARGRAFAAECLTALWSEAGKTALAGLRTRGLTDETIRAAGLGWNYQDRHEARDAWGLPVETDDKGRPRRVWLPRGVVIPWQVGPDLWRVNIRRPAEDLARDRARGIENPQKYIGPAGFGNGLYNADALRSGCVAVLVEGEIDALTVAQHAGDLAVAVATGSTHGARRTRWIARLALASVVLVAYDADPPGQAAGDYWLGVLSNAKRWRPWWEDANQMARDGADLRQWVAIGMGLDLPGVSSTGQAERAGLQQASIKPSTELALSPDLRFDDGVAERRFQQLRLADGHDLLLEFDSFVALETRCGELHAKLVETPHDLALQALYDGYAAVWLLCRGL